MRSVRHGPVSLEGLAVMLMLLAGTAGCDRPPSLSPQPLPAGLTYANNPAVYVKGVAIADNLPTLVGGEARHYASSPELPAGLTIDPESGVIAGTPLSVEATTVYTVSADNASGTATFDLTLTVNDVPPTHLTYAPNPVFYTMGEIIAPSEPTHDGGAVTDYLVDPPLPAGLSLNTATGAISGTPTATSDSTSYTVTASNSGGSTTALVSLTVIAPPGIAVQPVDQSLYEGMTATFDVAATGTHLAFQWRRNGEPIPGAQSSAFTTSTLALMDSGATFDVVVTDVVAHTVTSRAARLQVSLRAGFAATGPLGNPRFEHTATLLPSGKVLLVGGANGPLKSAELYDPASGTFSPTGSLRFARYDHTATLLQNGKVLIAAGFAGSSPRASAELYDPATGTFSTTGSLITARSRHTATLLPDGKVLIAGGRDATESAMDTAELYDPATGLFTATGVMLSEHLDHTATLLPNGKVLIVAGVSKTGLSAQVEIYDPDKATGKFGTMHPLLRGRYSHSTVLLPSGKLLILGGSGPDSDADASAEIYDTTPDLDYGSSTPTANLLTARYFHSTTLLPDGRVLVAGGTGKVQNTNGLVVFPALASAELYQLSPESNDFVFVDAGAMVTARTLHTATLLPDGTVLMAGGSDDSLGRGQAAAELYR